MNENVHNLIKMEYEKKQKQANDKLIERKKTAFALIPELKEVENKIQALGLTYSKLILSGKKPDDGETLSILNEIEHLRNIKKNLLTNNNLPKDYLELKYECEKCKDTGFVDNNGILTKCHCYRQKVINYLYNQSNLSLTKFENFDTFEEKYYSDVIDEKKYGIRISPRENILKIRERCLSFINNFESPNEKNLFFSGPPGVGKTFMASCIVKELLNMGKTVLYQTAPVMFNTINNYKYRFSNTEGYPADDAYKNIFEVELLIIDDLGIEPTTPSRYAELLTILNTRQTNNFTRPCKTIISTNIGPKQLYEYYTERVVSRIIGYFDRLIFAGEDIRAIKK